ncbi:MAG: hypothetical protein CMO34_03355 [Verrucomicrobia bacterium]|nr:hypothetical protein [Verrucomicrobiota bacterium]|tara:strand:- start:1327 stop:1575 length:249 start_codon:yes stop_codon:yes gene_type:complete
MVEHSFGFGVNQMISSEGKSFEDFISEPYRQYYFGLDVDLEKIETDKTWLRKVFKVFNHIKIPAPTVEFNRNSGGKFHWLYF